MVKQSEIKIPGFEDIEFEEYDIAKLASLDEDPEEFAKKVLKEEDFDKKLKDLALKCSELLKAAEKSDRASNYWYIGDLLVTQDKKLSVKRDRKSYEKKSNFLERLSKELNVSLRYLRAIYDFRALRRKNEVDDSIPWSIQFEYMELGDDRKAWKHYIKLYKSGKLTQKEKIRESIDDYMKTHKLPR